MAEAPPCGLPLAAFSELPARDPYRGPIWRAGLAAAGYQVIERAPLDRELGPESVALIWNRPQSKDAGALRVERAGGRVLVAENAYLGEGYRALALDHHSGVGRWPVTDGPERWAALGIELAPWREAGDHILVLGQRGIGHPSVAMPMGWDRRALQILARASSRPLRFRPHPDTVRDPAPLAADLAGCHAVVTWNSAAALRALVLGIPIFAGHGRWIARAAAMPFGADIERPFLGERLPVLERIACAQWSLFEIATGEPFRRLLAL